MSPKPDKARWQGATKGYLSSNRQQTASSVVPPKPYACLVFLCSSSVASPQICTRV